MIGVPDIIGCVGGRLVALELKTTSKLTPLQDYTLKKAARAGAYAREVRPENSELILSELLRMSKPGESARRRAELIEESVAAFGPLPTARMLSRMLRSA